MKKCLMSKWYIFCLFLTKSIKVLKLSWNVFGSRSWSWNNCYWGVRNETEKIWSIFLLVAKIEVDDFFFTQFYLKLPNRNDDESMTYLLFISLSFEAERVRAWFYNHGLLLLSVDRRRTDDHHYLTKFATTSFQKLHPLCFTPSPWWHFSFSIIAEVITWR